MLSKANIDGGLSIPNLPFDNFTIHCLIHMFLKKIANVIYPILSIFHHESIDFSVVISAMIVGAIGLMSNHLINALPLPANHTLTTKLTDTLKSITSNVSTSIQNDIDKVIADTMDITINNVLSQLSNATIIGNNDESTTNLALVPLPVSDQFSSLAK